MFREFIFSYIILVNKNIEEDVNPWDNIIVNLPYRPNFEFEYILIIIEAVCLTDE